MPTSGINGCGLITRFLLEEAEKTIIAMGQYYTNEEGERTGLNGSKGGRGGFEAANTRDCSARGGNTKVINNGHALLDTAALDRLQQKENLPLLSQVYADPQWPTLKSKWAVPGSIYRAEDGARRKVGKKGNNVAMQAVCQQPFCHNSKTGAGNNRFGKNLTRHGECGRGDCAKFQKRVFQ